jgi:hypothetical protein
MAPRKTSKSKQRGGDDVDSKLQHAVTTLNELAASLSAVLESRGVSVPDAPAPEAPPAEDAPADEPPAAEDAPADDAATGGGKKKKTSAKKAPKKK